MAKMVQRLAAGHGTDIDAITGFRHDRSTHKPLVEGSVLAWWLLSAYDSSRSWELLLPDLDSALHRYWMRTGLPAAATLHSLPIRYAGGDSDNPQDRQRLPGLDWEDFDYDDGSDTRHIRVIRDLESSQRRVPDLSSSGLHYPWLQLLKLDSPSLSSPGYLRFLSDADTVIAELIDNVHRWSEADSAFAVVSATRGGGERSWNRLHVVVADNGIGIPSALHNDLRALAAVHSASNVGDLDQLSDSDILQTLVFKAFGARELPNHNGHGLNATHIRAGQWVGAFDVLTINRTGRIVRAGTRGLSPEKVETGEVPLMPGARGTLVHVMLQAIDERETREQAAKGESLPFETHDYDEAGRCLYGSFPVPA
jgi:hypothetical protein